MIIKLFNTLRALYLFRSQVSIFYPEEIFRNKRVAIIGAAATAFEEKKGDYIETFDLIIRINKALHIWQPIQDTYIGKRTDILFHSFFENESSGGGPIDYERFVKDFNLQYLVHPDNSWRGTRTHINFYKRHPKKIPTFLLSREIAKELRREFKKLIPTVGFSALYALLNSPCKELYITGFTFFQTPYAKGYRDHLLTPEANYAHLKNQGLHSPDLEFQLFQKEVEKSSIGKISFDKGLSSLLAEKR